MIKHFVAMICLLAAIGVGKAQTLTIDSCYKLAFKNYPLIKQYDLIEKTKEYTISNADKAYLPQVSVTAIEGYVFGGFPSAGGVAEESSKFKFIGLGQINQTIWDGGATKTQKSIIEASSEVDKVAVDVSLHELHSRVNQLYFGILLIDEQLKLLEVQNAILTNNISRVRQLNENGLAYKTDVDEMRVEQLKLNQHKKNYNYTRKGYEAVLSYLVGIKLDEQTKLEKPIDLRASAGILINRPELLFFKSQRNLLTAQAGMQKVNFMPKIGLIGTGIVLAPGVNIGSGKLSAIGVAGISASWNITGLYRHSNDKQLTQVQMHKIDVQEKTFLFNTQLQMTQKSADIERQRAILNDDEEIVELRKAIREGYQLKYNNGVGPLMDLLNATQKESDALAQKALHEMQLLMTVYEHQTISGN